MPAGQQQQVTRAGQAQAGRAVVGQADVAAGLQQAQLAGLLVLQVDDRAAGALQVAAGHRAQRPGAAQVGVDGDVAAARHQLHRLAVALVQRRVGVGALLPLLGQRGIGGAAGLRQRAGAGRGRRHADALDRHIGLGQQLQAAAAHRPLQDRSTDPYRAGISGQRHPAGGLRGDVAGDVARVGGRGDGAAAAGPAQVAGQAGGGQAGVVVQPGDDIAAGLARALHHAGDQRRVGQVADAQVAHRVQRQRGVAVEQLQAGVRAAQAGAGGGSHAAAGRHGRPAATAVEQAADDVAAGLHRQRTARQPQAAGRPGAAVGAAAGLQRITAGRRGHFQIDDIAAGPHGQLTAAEGRDALLEQVIARPPGCRLAGVVGARLAPPPVGDVLAAGGGHDVAAGQQADAPGIAEEGPERSAAVAQGLVVGQAHLGPARQAAGVQRRAGGVDAHAVVEQAQVAGGGQRDVAHRAAHEDCGRAAGGGAGGAAEAQVAGACRSA